MKFDTRIALRYIFSFRSFHFISIISLISFFGIVIGVASIICSMSIFNGFREFTEKQLIGVDPHIRIASKKGPVLDNPEKVIYDLHKDIRIKSSSAVIQCKLIAIRGANIKPLILNGVKSDEYAKVSGVQKSVVVGSFKFSDSYGNPMLVLGAGLSDVLKILPGDSVSLLTFRDIETAVRSLSDVRRNTFRISGIFQTHSADYDDIYAYSDYETVKKISANSGGASLIIDIRANDIDKVSEIKNDLRAKFPDSEIQTWYDLHKDLYNVMQLERIAVFVILSLIIFLAIFNILASISMTVVEKRRDIGLLLALGARTESIKSIYLKEGLILGLIGTVSGTVLGLALCFGQLSYGWFKLSAAKYLITAIPVSVHFTDVLAVVALSVVLSFVSGYFPARNAAQSNISESLRNE